MREGNLYLTGFMGSGKTNLGQALAGSLGRVFLDLDSLVEQKAGMPIRQIFETLGQERFRELESEALGRAAERKRLVVATGGGLPESPANRSLMRKTGRIVHLKTKLDTCQKRIRGREAGTRPLWQDRNRIRDLFQSRAQAYADHDLEVSTDGREIPVLALEVMEKLFGEEEIRADLGGAQCPIRPGFQAPREVEALAQGRRVFILTDRRVGRTHLDRYTHRLPDHEVMIVPGGERIKTLATLDRIYGLLLARGFNRDDLFLALGGGAVTDLGALAAATYKRGMGLALAATSLLGCVDAAIGGKAGVNRGLVKNLIGCFTTPEAVLLDLPALATLDRTELQEGLVEAYKTGLVASPELASLIESETEPLLGGDLPLLARVAALSARAKADIVSRDFREGNLRMILNLGHTWGHAVESWNNYRVGHGLAVGAGLIAALCLSRQRGLLDPEQAQGMADTVRRICGPIPDGPPLEKGWELMQKDKKNKGGRVLFVLLRGPGEPVVIQDLEPEELAQALAGHPAQSGEVA